ncbi:MAG: serine/threonine-protein kinase [Planctomycetota bacterium]|nr:serine/threonine-protein kinase [Planctomycetota bacterium]
MADEADLPPITDAGTERGDLPPGHDQVMPPGTRLGDYEILEKIGSGGMGTVYKAYEHALKRVVALKVLHREIASNPSFVKRFHREAVLAANLSHPNIVPVFHVDPQASPPFFAMEFVHGISLKDKVEKEGFLQPEEAIRIILQACDALQHAHRNNIIHRDVKPANILLQNHLQRVRISDFGIAQDVTGQIAEVTQTEGLTAGTVAYMSPEQNLGQPLDHRTDIFSLGMTLYFILTGRTAYRARNRAELALAFQGQTPLGPSRLNPQVPPVLDDIVLKMIAVDPAKRYPSCDAVSDDLKDVLAGENAMVCAAKPHAPVRAYRFPLLATIVGIIIVGLAIGLWAMIGGDKHPVGAVVPPQPSFGPGPNAIVMISDLHPSPFRYNNIARPLEWSGDFVVEAWVKVDSHGKMAYCPPTVGGLRLFFEDGRYVVAEITNRCFSFTPGSYDQTEVPAPVNTWYRYQIKRTADQVTCSAFDRENRELAKRTFAFGRQDVKKIILATYNADGGRTYWGGIRTPAFIDHCDTLSPWEHEKSGDVQVNPAHTLVADVGDHDSGTQWRTIFEDDFEKWNEGEHPSQWADLTGGGDDVVTTQWSADGKKSFCSLSRNGSWLKRPVIRLKGMEGNASDHLRYECVIHMEATPRSSAVVGFFFTDPRFRNQVPHANALVFGTDGHITWSGPTGGETGQWQPGSWELGSWPAGKEATYTVRVDIDFAGGKADVWLNGNVIKKGLPAWPKVIPASSVYRSEVPLDNWGFGLAGNWWSGGGPGRVFMDEVRIRVR